MPPAILAYCNQHHRLANLMDMEMPTVDYEYFQSIPWCAKLLAEPDIIIVATPGRQEKESTESEFFAVTLKTKTTIPFWLSFYKRPAPGAPCVYEVHNLLSVGPGVNGYAHRVAGGVIGAVIDEVMGTVGLVNMNLDHLNPQGIWVTANLNINFRKAVPTPGVYLATATFRGVKGRKCYCDASIKDGEGTVLATATSVWIDSAAKL